MNKKGFTLVEMMVVIAIIGILSAIVGPQVGSALNKAKIVAAKVTTKQVATAIISYKDDNGYYPGPAYATESSGLSVYSYYYGNAENLNSYLMAPGHFYLQKKLALDPWSSGYFYHMYTCSWGCHPACADFVFYSSGPDKINSSWDCGMWLNTAAFAGDDIGEIVDAPWS